MIIITSVPVCNDQTLRPVLALFLTGREFFDNASRKQSESRRYFWHSTAVKAALTAKYFDDFQTLIVTATIILTLLDRRIHLSCSFSQFSIPHDRWLIDISGRILAVITLTSVPVCNDQVLLGNHLLALNNLPVADADGVCDHGSCVSANCKTKLNVDNLGIDHS